LKPLSKTYGSIKVPLLLFTSTNDHVVNPKESDFLASRYAGSIERVVLERSFHVATQDVEKETVNAKALEFARRVTA
jgi:carboxylesterase